MDIIIPQMSNLMALIPDPCISLATNNIWDKFGQMSEELSKPFLFYIHYDLTL